MPYKDPQAARDYQQSRRTAGLNKDKEREWRLQTLYRMTPVQYDQILDHQGGVCACCGFIGVKRLAVDHNHSTGLIRGLLCWSCNYAIGVAKDDSSKLRRLADYLDSPPAPRALGCEIYGLLGKARRKKKMIYGSSAVGGHPKPV